jgi:hypothetical protein
MVADGRLLWPCSGGGTQETVTSPSGGKQARARLEKMINSCRSVAQAIVPRPNALIHLSTSRNRRAAGPVKPTQTNADENGICATPQMQRDRNKSENRDG